MNYLYPKTKLSEKISHVFKEYFGMQFVVSMSHQHAVTFSGLQVTPTS